MNLHFFEWGPKSGTPPAPATPTLLFLHGMGGTGAIWRAIAAQLEDHFLCIAPDQRAHGESRPVPPGEDTLFKATDYARDVKQLIETQGWRDVIVIGHSMGARNALALGHLCVGQPGLIRRVVCVDIGMKGAWGGGMGKPLAEFLENLPREFNDRKVMRDYLFANCPDASIAQYLSAVAKNVAATDEPERIVFPFDHEDVVETIRQANQSQQDSIPAWAVELARIGTPVMFLHGATSKVWPKADYDAQKAQYESEGIEFQTWENCGHGLPFEQRAKFVEFVKGIAN
ncbi:MAG: alpha/beta hydrolase [Bdellovibrionales bacterium]|nr:alpha/beta hydrolase [Bdellovibrionales bacterium]